MTITDTSASLLVSNAVRRQTGRVLSVSYSDNTTVYIFYFGNTDLYETTINKNPVQNIE